MMDVRQEPMFVDIETVQSQAKQEHESNIISSSTDDLMFEKVLLPDQSIDENQAQKSADRNACSKLKPEKNYKCSYCDYATYNSVLMREHEYRHRGLKPYKCAHCTYRSNSKRNRNKHQSRHSSSNPLHCLHCDFLASSQGSLSRHVKDEHSKPDDVVDLHESVYQHRQSDLKTDDKKHDRHIEQHDSNDDDVMTCDKCDFVTYNLHVYKKHSLSHKSGVKSKKKNKEHLFSCKECGWCSGSKMKILLHLIHHPNQTVDEKLIDVSILRKYDIYR